MLSHEDKVGDADFVEGIADVGLGALVKEVTHDILMAVHGGEVERGLAVGCLGCFGFDGGAVLEQGFHRGEVALARGGEQIFVRIPGE